MTTLSLVGRLPELDVGLSNGLHVVSMMTAEGNPEWALIKRIDSASSSIRVQAGRLHIEELIPDLTS